MCVCVGLNDAGKTTILYKLKGGDSVVTIPTVGNEAYSCKNYIKSYAIATFDKETTWCL